ncbi:hypothetical protein ACB092_07G129400 [Castanea dentata]
MTEYWVSQGNKWCDFYKIFKANCSNQKDIAKLQELGVRLLNELSFETTQLLELAHDEAIRQVWWLEENVVGKWVTQEEAYATPQFSSNSKHQAPTLKKLLSASEAVPVTENKVQTSLNPMRSIKGTPSSVAIGKRKKQDEKLKVISKEEAAALKAREAAKKRVEETGKTIKLM